MLSQTSEYALRAMVCLASYDKENKKPYINASEIARSTKVPITYLSKVLQRLVKGGFVSQKRGIKGGFQLLPSPEKVTLFSIVQLFDKIKRIHLCPLNLHDSDLDLCPLHAALDNAACILISNLSAITLQDLIDAKKAGQVETLCQ